VLLEHIGFYTLSDTSMIISTQVKFNLPLFQLQRETINCPKCRHCKPEFLGRIDACETPGYDPTWTCRCKNFLPKD